MEETNITPPSKKTKNKEKADLFNNQKVLYFGQKL